MAYANNVQGYLAENLTVGAVSIVLVKPTAPFNTPPAGGGLLTISDDLSVPTALEIVSYGGVIDNGATLTLTGVNKGEEGTEDVAWNAGAVFYQSVTAGQLDKLTAIALAGV